MRSNLLVGVELINAQSMLCQRCGDLMDDSGMVGPFDNEKARVWEEEN